MKGSFEREEVCGLQDLYGFPNGAGTQTGKALPCAQLGPSGLPSLVLTSGKEAFSGDSLRHPEGTAFPISCLPILLHEGWRSSTAYVSPSSFLSTCSTTWTHQATSATIAQPCRGPHRGPRWPTATERRSSSLYSTFLLRTSTSSIKSIPTTCPMGILTSR